MKTCTKCGNQKLFSQFNKRKASVDGLQPICNLCSKTRLKLNYSKKMDSIDGHIEMILAKIKKRAKDNNLNFNLTVAYLKSIIVITCPILNVELTWCKKSGKPTNDSPSLDRFKPKLGYVEGNVGWMSFRANRLKNDSSVEEIEKLLNWMKSFA